MPLPIQFDVLTRVKQLNNCLDPNHEYFQPEGQHRNIQALIKMYESGEVDGSGEICIMEGKVVSRNEAFRAPTWVWVEVCYLILVI